MEICLMIVLDILFCTIFRPKDAVKAIRKRLQQNTGKNYTVVLYTLTVLETCVKNCKRRFHLLVMQKDFILELVKLIGPKNDPPAAVQEKVLSLIQSWADAFQGNPEMQGVVQVYHDLKQKGIEFPMTDLDAMAPIHTPQRVSCLISYKKAVVVLDGFYKEYFPKRSKSEQSVLPSSSPPSVVSDQTVHAAQVGLIKRQKTSMLNILPEFDNNIGPQNTLTEYLKISTLTLATIIKHWTEIEKAYAGCGGKSKATPLSVLESDLLEWFSNICAKKIVTS
ncbi:UNVERIFIED_CONTAM: Tom1l2 [Trichonephila clavipes]